MRPDLRTVEQVTGSMGYGRAALQGAGPGAVIGALFGWLFGIFGALDPLVADVLLALYGLIFGAILGAVFGLAAHFAMGGRRDISSIEGLRAGRDDVEVDEELAERAMRLLQEHGG